MAFVITEPYQFIAGLDGEALDAGTIYYGEPNKDPIQFPKSVFYDSGLTIPAPQPLRTVNGYIVRNGTPTSLFASGNYSVLVLDKHGRQVYFVADFQLIGNAVAITTSQVPFPVDSIAALRLLNKNSYSYATVTGYYAKGDGGGGLYYLDAADVTSVDNGGTIIVAADLGRWKLTYKDQVTVKQFGAKTDGTGASARIQAAFDSGVKSILVTGGDYTIDTTLVPPLSTLDLKFEKDARFIPAANNLTIIKSTVSAYYFRCESVSIFGNGKTGIVGFDMTNMRLYSGLRNCKFQNIATGFIGRDGCFGMYIENLTAEAVTNPINFLSNNSGATVINPNFDNGVGVGGSGLGIGIGIDGVAASNLSIAITGGYIQGYESGIFDNGRGTAISDVYFENCSVADINSSGSFGGRYTNLGHWGGVGPTGYRFRNSDGFLIFNPIMGSGARTALFDVDSSNTNGAYYLSGSSAFLNTPTGSTANMAQIAAQAITQTFTPTVAGTGTTGVGTYTLQSGKVSFQGKQIHVEIEVAWTAHTGTGNMVVRGIPVGFAPTNFTPKRIAQVGMSGFAFTGPVVYAFLNGSTTELSVVQVSTAGAESLISLPSTGTLRINLIYENY